MMNKRILAMGIILVAVTSMTAWVRGDSAPGESDLSMLVLAPLPDECNASCEDDAELCTIPHVERHEYETGPFQEGWEFDGEGGYHCVTGSCEGHGHTECDGGAEDDAALLNDLYLALATLEGADLRRLLVRNRERLRWNPERLSVQVLGCEGRVMTSVILSEHQGASLEG